MFGRWFFDWPRSPALRALTESAFEGFEPLQIEETVEAALLVVRAELPGIDPDRDVEISVQDRTLNIRAERRRGTKEKTKGHHRSEFHYGSFARRIPHLAGVSEDQVTASYKDGILEVWVPRPARKPKAARKIPVQRTEEDPGPTDVAARTTRRGAPPPGTADQRANRVYLWEGELLMGNPRPSSDCGCQCAPAATSSTSPGSLTPG